MPAAIPLAASAPMSAAIRDAIEGVWSEAGVAIMVDLGAAEMNAEMAIEMLPDRQRRVVRICNAPVVEGAVLGGDRSVGRQQPRRGLHDRRIGVVVSAGL